MQFFYDGQIRRYLTQTIRVLSNFTVKYGDGRLVRVPVIYGDQDRQVANIIKQNSASTINAVPRIAVYISGLDLDSSRLSDSTFIGKVHVRERGVDNSDPNNPVYTHEQGRNYTVERLMPTPFKLTLKCDIWTSSTDQKLQLLEQILVLFNPTLELQTTDNYIDWTSLTTLSITHTSWSSRTVPVGNDTPIDIASLTFETPIWISPPTKVKHLGVITKIITSIYGSSGTNTNEYIEGLGLPITGPDTTFSDLLTREVTTVSNYNLEVYGNQAILLSPGENTSPVEPTLDVPVRNGLPVNWQTILDQYPGKYVAGSSMLYLTQPNGSEVVGTIAINPLDTSLLQVTWDSDTLVSNTGIDSNGNLDTDHAYNIAGSYRPGSPGTFDAIIDPLNVGPNDTKLQEKYGALSAGRRYLIVEDIGNSINEQPSEAWGNIVAKANDIIEYTGTDWHVIFNAAQEADTMIWQTNIYTGVQYVWNGVNWGKSFEGEYRVGQWRIEL